MERLHQGDNSELTTYLQVVCVRVSHSLNQWVPVYVPCAERDPNSNTEESVTAETHVTGASLARRGPFLALAFCTHARGRKDSSCGQVV
jgi:hypothetical protein